MQITLGRNTVDTFTPAILLGKHMTSLLRNRLKDKVSFIFRLCPVHNPAAVNNSSFLKNLMEELCYQ